MERRRSTRPEAIFYYNFVRLPHFITRAHLYTYLLIALCPPLCYCITLSLSLSISSSIEDIFVRHVCIWRKVADWKFSFFSFFFSEIVFVARHYDATHCKWDLFSLFLCSKKNKSRKNKLPKTENDHLMRWNTLKYI